MSLIAWEKTVLCSLMVWQGIQGRQQQAEQAVAVVSLPSLFHKNATTCCTSKVKIVDFLLKFSLLFQIQLMTMVSATNFSTNLSRAFAKVLSITWIAAMGVHNEQEGAENTIQGGSGVEHLIGGGVTASCLWSVCEEVWYPVAESCPKCRVSTQFHFRGSEIHKEHCAIDVVQERINGWMLYCWERAGTCVKNLIKLLLITHLISYLCLTSLST